MFFHALTFAGSRGCCLNTRPIGQVFNIIRRNDIVSFGFRGYRGDLRIELQAPVV